MTGPPTKAAEERRFFTALADKTEAEAFACSVEVEQFKASQHNSRIYSFGGAVTSGSAAAAIDTLGQWHRETPEKTIQIVFNSPGGGVIPGLALFDYIKTLQDQGTEINTRSIGMAASMGGILLQAGGERTMGAHAYMLIHELSSGAVGSTTEVEDELKFMKRLQERALSILADRSTMSKRQIERKWKRRDWWLDADEALEYGFIDRIY